MLQSSPAYRVLYPARRVKPSHHSRRGMVVHLNVNDAGIYDYVRNIRVPKLDAVRTYRRGVYGLVSSGASGSNAGAEYNGITRGPANNGDMTVAFQLANCSGLSGAVLTVGTEYPSVNGVGFHFSASGGTVYRNGTGGTFLGSLPAVTTTPRWLVYTQTAAGACNIYYDGNQTPSVSSSGNSFDTGNVDCIWFFKNTYLDGGQACSAGTLVNNVALWNRALSASEASEWVKNQQNVFAPTPYLKMVRGVGTDWAVDAENTFTLDSSPAPEFDRAATNVSGFDLSNTATATFDRAVSASSDIAFSATTRINVVAVSAVSGISFGAASNNIQTFSASATSAIDFSQDAAGRNTIIRVSAVTSLDLSSGESSGNDWVRSIANNIQFESVSTAVNTTIVVTAFSGMNFDGVLYRSGVDWPVSSSSELVFSSTTDGGKAYSASASSSINFDVSITSNFFVSSTVNFTSTAVAFREQGPASSSFALGVTASSVVQLPAAAAKIKNASFTGISKRFPVHFAETPSGLLLISDGIDNVLRWDGVSRNFIPAGIIAPTTAPTLSSSGSGAISGTYTAYVRFMDAEGNVSNLSPISNSITVSGVESIVYSDVPRPTEGRVTKRQILRNTSGQASVYYVDLETTDITTTQFESTLEDAELGTQEAVALLDTDNKVIVNLYDPPPSHKAVACSHLSRMFLAAEVEYREGHIEVASGSTTVQGVGTDFRSTFVGRVLYVVDGNQSYTISAVDEVAQTLTLDEPYGTATNRYAVYAIRPRPSERKLIYYSESGQPEAWPPVNAISIQEDGDEITGLFAQSSFLYIVEKRHIYRFTFQDDPATDGFPFAAASRGSINQRCIVKVEDSAYMLDEWGIHRFGGDQASESVSAPIQTLFRPNNGDTLGINWSGDTRLWHAAHSPVHDTIRWFVSMTGFREPRHAICLNYRQQRWWIEEYPWPMTGSCVATIGYRRSLIGSDGRRILATDSGTLDGIPEAIGTLGGQVTSAGPCSITVAGADFTTPDIINSPVVISRGPGLGQSRRIVSASGDTLYLDRPWSARPTSESYFQIGGISWEWNSPWYRYAEVEDSNDRSIEVGFEPDRGQSFATLNLFVNYSRQPKTLAYTRSQDGVSVTKDEPDIYIDLGRAGGTAKFRQEGHSDPGASGREEIVSVRLSGIQGQAPTSIYHVKINGAG